MDEPNRRAKPRTKRFHAVWLNLILPGAGQFYLGNRVLGVVLAILFLMALGGVLAVAGHGFYRYYLHLAEGDILEADNLERLAGFFRLPWLIGSLGLGLLVWLLSEVLLLFEPKDDPPHQA